MQHRTKNTRICGVVLGGHIHNNGMMQLKFGRVFHNEVRKENGKWLG